MRRASGGEETGPAVPGEARRRAVDGRRPGGARRRHRLPCRRDGGRRSAPSPPPLICAASSPLDRDRPFLVPAPRGHEGWLGHQERRWWPVADAAAAPFSSSPASSLPPSSCRRAG